MRKPSPEISGLNWEDWEADLGGEIDIELVACVFFKMIYVCNSLYDYIIGFLLLVNFC